MYGAHGSLEFRLLPKAPVVFRSHAHGPPVFPLHTLHLGPAMLAQLTPRERRRVDAIVRGKKRTVADALKNINKARERRGVEPTTHNSISAVCPLGP